MATWEEADFWIRVIRKHSGCFLVILHRQIRSGAQSAAPWEAPLAWRPRSSNVRHRWTM